MPRKLWYRLIIIACVYAFGTEFVWPQERIETMMGLSEGAWFAGVLGSYALISGSVYWHARRAGRGTVTASGLERENGPVIPFSRVGKIVWEGRGFPAVVFVAGGQVRMHLQDRDFIKLSQTRLNSWTIDDDGIIVALREQAGQELRLSYAPVGMYSTFFVLARWALIFSVMAKVFSNTFGGDAKLLFLACLFCGLLFCILPYYRRVKVTVEADRVLLKRGKKEESFRFGDVVGMEQGLFQVKVTAKDGRVFFFPRGCVFLPEIVEEFAGLFAH